MKKLILVFSLLITGNVFGQKTEIGNLIVEGVPTLDAGMEEQFQKYQNLRTASFASWANDGGMFISTRFGDVNQIHHVAKPGADRKQITFFKEPINNVSLSPNNNQNGFIIQKDKGGNENYQIYFFDLKTSEARLLTDGVSRNLFQAWNHGGSKIAFTSNQKNPANTDLFVRDLKEENDNMLLELKGGGWSVQDWSRDGSKMILSNYVSVNESHPYLYELKTNKLDAIFDVTEKISFKNVHFSADEKTIFYESNKNTEFTKLRSLDLKSKTERIISKNETWDIDGYQISKDKSMIVYSINEAGYSKMIMYNTISKKSMDLVNIPKGVIGFFDINQNNTHIGLTLTKPNLPAEAYSYEIASNKLSRWTYSELFGLDANSFRDASIIDFKSFDDLKVSSFYYKPIKKSDKKLPVLISIHGGPEGQSVANFNSFLQFVCTELKVAVLVPNVRGSTGYGKTFLNLDNAELRENSVKDIGALLDWVKTQPDLDPERVIVYGGSYGGYMCLASMTNYNDRLRAGINLFGISNFTTFLKNTSPYRADLRRAEYGDERKPEMAKVFEQISPINKIKNITKPMLVYQGLNDPRVPFSESQQMVDALKAQGNKTWYVIAKDEGHSLAKKANRDFMNVAMLMFIKENLK
jgi:dipeptidyl aminopeptidase/acylaminoacyl peptidase